MGLAEEPLDRPFEDMEFSLCLSLFLCLTESEIGQEEAREEKPR